MPMGGLQKDVIYGLPDWYCVLVLKEFKELGNNMMHRNRIAGAYADGLNKNVLSKTVVGRVQLSANLRFPIFVRNRGGLINYLKQNNIFVSDIWYDAPVAPRRFLHLTDYKNQCPKAEKVSGEILNLPTHRNVSEENARRVVHLINQWLEKNK
jgi:dTDP-4-amino-4,6-dideoxygalactose transaminase